MSVIARTVRIHTLPLVRLSTVSETPGVGFLPVDHQVDGQHVQYWRNVHTGPAARWRSFAKFPLVLNADGSPWEPACLWLLDRALAQPLRLSSLPSVAQSLCDYKWFLDEMGLVWDDFAAVDKYARPTYLYTTHLQGLVSDGSIKRSTASRRMSAVIGLYRFLRQDPRMRFDPVNAPWVERRVSFLYKDSKGFAQSQSAITTDVSVSRGARDDAWDGTINDGGKLRPLPTVEQRALVAALKALGNTEYELMHYVSLLTGARTQTVLTLRLKNFLRPPSSIASWPLKLRCGPGTGIDTKRDVANVHLIFPHSLYELLHVYANSPRAKGRRAKTRLGEDSDNYLFLTSHGAPYYESKDDRSALPSPGDALRRSSPVGQNLREFISEYVIPEVQRKIPGFKYRFHDLRATFGMNWVDHALRSGDTVEKYIWAREQLRRLMWHKDATTTDSYLSFRQHMRRLEAAQAEWNADLIRLILQVS